MLRMSGNKTIPVCPLIDKFKAKESEHDNTGCF